MCVAYADKIHIDMFQLLLPLFMLSLIFVHGVTWCGMDQQEFCAIYPDHQMSGDGHLSQPGQVRLITQHIKMVLAASRPPFFEKFRLGRTVMRCAMNVVVAAHDTAAISWPTQSMCGRVGQWRSQRHRPANRHASNFSCSWLRVRASLNGYRQQEYSQGMCCFRSQEGRNGVHSSSPSPSAECRTGTA